MGCGEVGKTDRALFCLLLWQAMTRVLAKYLAQTRLAPLQVLVLSMGKGDESPLSPGDLLESPWSHSMQG